MSPQKQNLPPKANVLYLPRSFAIKLYHALTLPNSIHNMCCFFKLWIIEMMGCYRPGTPKCRNYIYTWIWMYGWTSSGKEVASWEQVCTDYAGGKVTVCSLFYLQTMIRGKFKLYSLLEIQYMNAYYFTILVILGISATVLDRTWPGPKNPF